MPQRDRHRHDTGCVPDSGARRRGRWRWQAPAEKLPSTPGPTRYGCPCLPENSGTTAQIFCGADRRRPAALHRRCAGWRPIHQRDDGGVASAIEHFLQSHLQGTELSPAGIGIGHQRRSVGISNRRQSGFVLARHDQHEIGRRASANEWPPKEKYPSMAAARAICGGQGSRALSVPMREDSPAARITPAKLGERGHVAEDSRKREESQ